MTFHSTACDFTCIICNDKLPTLFAANKRKTKENIQDILCQKIDLKKCVKISNWPKVKESWTEITGELDYSLENVPAKYICKSKSYTKFMRCLRNFSFYPVNTS